MLKYRMAGPSESRCRGGVEKIMEIIKDKVVSVIDWSGALVCPRCNPARLRRTGNSPWRLAGEKRHYISHMVDRRCRENFVRLCFGRKGGYWSETTARLAYSANSTVYLFNNQLRRSHWPGSTVERQDLLIGSPWFAIMTPIIW